MRKVVCIADNILSPLGTTGEENYRAVLQGKSGVAKHSDDLTEDFFASLTDREKVLQLAGEKGIDSSKFTYFELMCVLSASDAIANAAAQLNSAGSLPLDRTQLILSTTKGNISLSLNQSEETETSLQHNSTSRCNCLPANGQAISGDNSSQKYAEDRISAIRLTLYHSAEVINDHFGFSLRPVVISNACISGVCAEIEALRRIRAGLCDYAVVVGCDEQSRFIVSGFQSFKALAPEPCRPFDANRKGLNLGEAAATVVLAAEDCLAEAVSPTHPAMNGRKTSRWEIVDGAIRNDANHISGPSRTGEGSYRALKYVLDSPLWNNCDDRPASNIPSTCITFSETPECETADYSSVADQIAVINAHGTATAYNDEMESIAIDRAGLSAVPVNSLKGYFGHTMGAAGILETIITMHATAEGVLLPTKGYSECGVSRPLNISSEARTTDKRSFIKLISGFGGCNAAIGFRFNGCEHTASSDSDHASPTSHTASLDSAQVSPTSQTAELPQTGLRVNDCNVIKRDDCCFAVVAEASVTADEDLAEAYRSLGCEYPKFFKMDPLCKTGFIASERLLRQFRPSQNVNTDKDHYDTGESTVKFAQASAENFTEIFGGENTAIVLMNRSASLCNDLHYCKTILDKEHYFPSPALFVYTLPNIVTGEIAIRNKFYGESIFYICDSPSDRLNDTQADGLNDSPVNKVNSIKKIAEGHNDIAGSALNKVLEATKIAFQDRDTENVIAGWVEASPEGRCEAKILAFTKNHRK